MDLPFHASSKSAKVHTALWVIPRLLLMVQIVPQKHYLIILKS